MYMYNIYIKTLINTNTAAMHAPPPRLRLSSQQ